MGGALQLEFFSEGGFQRQRCRACGSHFWALEKQPLCGDAPCVEYSFLGTPLFDQPFGLAEMREAFLAFFEARGHKRVERAPVVARWRDRPPTHSRFRSPASGSTTLSRSAAAGAT